MTGKALITGGAGFIGGFLAERLLGGGWTVDILDNFARGRSDAFLDALLARDGARLVQCDLLDRDAALETLDRDYTHIFHFAAILGVQNVIDNPDRTLSANVALLDSALALAKAQGALDRFIFASTSEVYAGSLELLDLTIPTPEDHVLAVPDLGRPRTSYMLSKIYGEAMTRLSGLPYTILRPHNVYGPRMGQSHVVPQLLQKAYDAPNGGSIEVFSLDHTRTFCFIEDAVEMIVRTATAKTCRNQVLNLGAQEPEYRIEQLADTVIATVGKNLSIRPGPEHQGSPSRRAPDMSRMLDLTGYRARVDLQDGVARTYAWYRPTVFEGNKAEGRGMIPLAIPQMTGREAAYLMDCVETNFVSSVGAYVDRFEEMVAAAGGAARAIATSAGTTGLHAALAAVGVGRDDLVILPSFTFIASANAIAQCGADPWLFDIDPDSWTLDPVLLAAALAEATERQGDRLLHRATGRRVAAIMPVTTLGMPADMDAISAVAREHGLPVVVDGAAALGATYKGRPSGALGADLTVYSFNGNKTVTAGGGGAVAGGDADLLALVKHLTTTARVGADYTHDRVGFNYRMTNLQAAVGCAQMESLDDFVVCKHQIAARYNSELAVVDGLGAFPDPDWADSACWFSGVTVDPARYGSVDTLRAALRESGIDARPFWKPVHLQAPFADAPCQDQRVSEALWGRVLTLPCSTGLTDDEQSFVIETVRKLLAGAA